MKRYAAHYLYLPIGKVYEQHYFQLDGDNHLVGIFPLIHEISQTGFYNGILWLVPQTEVLDIQSILNKIRELRTLQPAASIFTLLDQLEIPLVPPNIPVSICQLNGVDIHKEGDIQIIKTL